MGAKNPAAHEEEETVDGVECFCIGIACRLSQLLSDSQSRTTGFGPRRFASIVNVLACLP